jgi:hypothetical protein
MSRFRLLFYPRFLIYLKIFIVFFRDDYSIQGMKTVFIYNSENLFYSIPSPLVLLKHLTYIKEWGTEWSHYSNTNQ